MVDRQRSVTNSDKSKYTRLNILDRNRRSAQFLSPQQTEISSLITRVKLFMDKNFITFLINLKRSPDRLQKMKTELEKQNIDFERIEAIDANNLSQSDFDICDTPNIEYPYRIKDGELACFLSHRMCWEKFIKSEKEWGLIIEDHCVLSPKAYNYLRSTDWIPKECEIIQFVFTQKPVSYRKEIHLPDGNSLLNIAYSSPIGTSGYFISRRAAEIALQHSNRILSPIDNYLFGSWSIFTKKVSCWRLRGAVIQRDSSLISTIKDRHKKKRKFYLSRYMIKASLFSEAV